MGGRAEAKRESLGKTAEIASGFATQTMRTSL